MAKIVAEFDTQTKELSVTMNGKAVKDVSVAYFMADWEDKKKGFVELSTVSTDENEGMAQVTRIMASEEDFTVVRDDSVRKEIAKLYAKRR